jgi:hypothetical protein
MEDSPGLLKKVLDDDWRFIQMMPQLSEPYYRHMLTLPDPLTNAADGLEWLQPTIHQYAAFHNKPRVLFGLLRLSASHSVPFTDCFHPRNLREPNLLILAVCTPCRTSSGGRCVDALESLLIDIDQNYPDLRAALVNDTDRDNLSALSYAVGLSHTQAISLLLTAGADPLLAKASARCPLVMAVLHKTDALLLYRTIKAAYPVAQFCSMFWNRNTKAADAEGGSYIEDLLYERAEKRAARSKSAESADAIRRLADEIRADAGRGPAPVDKFKPISLQCLQSPCSGHVSAQCPRCRGLFCADHALAHTCEGPVAGMAATRPADESPGWGCHYPGCGSLDDTMQCPKCGQYYCWDHIDDHDYNGQRCIRDEQ